MLRETIDSTLRILRDTVFRITKTRTTDSNEADQFAYTEEKCINERVVKWKYVWKHEGGNRLIAAESESDLNTVDLIQLVIQWNNEYEVAQPLTRTVQENLQMEVNGTVLRQETTWDRDTFEITRKRSIGDKFITAKTRQNGAENENKTGSELRARYLELREFNLEWDQLWRPDGSS